jgi:hypothetical protein
MYEKETRKGVLAVSKKSSRIVMFGDNITGSGGK